MPASSRSSAPVPWLRAARKLEPAHVCAWLSAAAFRRRYGGVTAALRRRYGGVEEAALGLLGGGVAAECSGVEAA